MLFSFAFSSMAVLRLYIQLCMEAYWQGATFSPIWMHFSSMELVRNHLHDGNQCR